MTPIRTSFAFRLSALYFIAAALWIWFSDKLADLLISNPDHLMIVQQYKGWAFVAVTAVMLYSLMNRKLRAVREAEAERRAAENQLSSVLSIASDAIIALDASHRVVSFNLGAQRMFGYSETEARGLLFDQLVPSPSDGSPGLLVRMDNDAEITWHSDGYREVRARRKNGSQFSGEISVSSLDHDHHVTYIAILRDVTPRKHAEETVQMSQARIEAILDNSPTVITIKDLDGRFMSVNIEFESLVGMTRDKIIGRTDYAIFPKEAADIFRQNDAELIATRTPMYVEEIVLVREGPMRTYLVNKFLLYDANHNPIATCGIATNITERKLVENALRESEARFRVMADSAPLMIWIAGLDKGYEYFNKGWYDFTGRTLKEERGSGWMSRIHPHDVDQCREIYTNAFDMRVHYTMEYRMKRFDGEYRWLMDTGVPRYNEDGSFAGYIGSAVDVTERRRAEEALMEMNTQLEQRVQRRTIELTAANERLKELDKLRTQFIANVTHELRNPVASLAMRLYLMERGGPDTYAEHIDVLQDQTSRLKSLINSVMDLSRVELSHTRVSLAPVDLNDVVYREVMALETHAEDAGLRLTRTLATNLPLVVGERNQLAQIVSNLVGNSIRYTPRGQVRVETYFDQEREQACLMVTDTGLGIDEDDLPHLFERFYRGRTATKSEIPGTGLGLSIVKEIIELHDGEIEVESKRGKGSTFRVWLPVTERVMA
jgi:PAS domain S-box-containing protein